MIDFDNMSIWDFIADTATPDFKEMTTEQIARYISDRTGLEFKQDKDLGDFRVVINKIEFSVHKSAYTYKGAEGVPFISCGVQQNYGHYQGVGSPIDSLESAVEFFRKNKKAFLSE